MTRLILGLSMLVMLALSVCSATGEAAYAQQRETYRQQVAEYSSKVDALRKEMEAGTWTQLQLDEYLHTAMWLVYSAKLYANIGFGPDVERTNDDLLSLVEIGALPHWPGNPLNDWEPMQVLASGDPFSPGDLCFNLCPDSYGSTHRKVKRRFSFDLFVLGATDQMRGPDVNTFPGDNREWDSAPAGAIYSVSYWMVSDKAREESARIWKQKHPNK